MCCKHFWQNEVLPFYQADRFTPGDSHVFLVSSSMLEGWKEVDALARGHKSRDSGEVAQLGQFLTQVLHFLLNSISPSYPPTPS